MSDYLSNLAARSLGQADVVRPRPVSLFAPPPRVAGWPPIEQADERAAAEREQRPAEPRAPTFLAAAPHADAQAAPRPTEPAPTPPIGWGQPPLPAARPAPPPAADVAASALRASEAPRRPVLEPAVERVIVER